MFWSIMSFVWGNKKIRKLMGVFFSHKLHCLFAYPCNLFSFLLLFFFFSNKQMCTCKWWKTTHTHTNRLHLCCVFPPIHRLCNTSTVPSALGTSRWRTLRWFTWTRTLTCSSPSAWLHTPCLIKRRCSGQRMWNCNYLFLHVWRSVQQSVWSLFFFPFLVSWASRTGSCRWCTPDTCPTSPGFIRTGLSRSERASTRCVWAGIRLQTPSGDATPPCLFQECYHA